MLNLFEEIHAIVFAVLDIARLLRAIKSSHHLMEETPYHVQRAASH